MAAPLSDPTPPWYPAVSTMWSRLERTSSPERFLRSVCGLDRKEAAAARGVAILMDPRVPRFLDEVTHFAARMRPATSLEIQESRGVLTGAVQWSQTIALWSHGFGKGERFICGTPQRSYDNAENRLVVDVIDRLVRSARAVERRSVLVVDDAELERAVDVAHAARLIRRHPRFAEVRPEQLAARDLSKLAGTLRRQGDPCTRLAMNLRRRLAQPVPPGIIGRFGSDDINNHLGVLITAADGLLAHGLDSPPPEITEDGVCIGPLAFRRSDAEGGPSGLWFGPHRVTFARRGTAGGAGYDGTGWIVEDAASTLAVLASVADDLRSRGLVQRVA